MKQSKPLWHFYLLFPKLPVFRKDRCKRLIRRAGFGHCFSCVGFCSFWIEIFSFLYHNSYLNTKVLWSLLFTRYNCLLFTIIYFPLKRLLNNDECIQLRNLITLFSFFFFPPLPLLLPLSSSFNLLPIYVTYCCHRFL